MILCVSSSFPGKKKNLWEFAAACDRSPSVSKSVTELFVCVERRSETETDRQTETGRTERGDKHGFEHIETLRETALQAGDAYPHGTCERLEEREIRTPPSPNDTHGRRRRKKERCGKTVLPSICIDALEKEAGASKGRQLSAIMINPRVFHICAHADSLARLVCPRLCRTGRA